MLPRELSKCLLTAAAICALGLCATTPVRASSSITLARYDQRADAVCQAYHRQAAQLPHVLLSNYPGLVKLVGRALPIVSAAIAKLRAIPLPQVKRNLVKLWLQRHYRIPRLLRALKSAAEKKSPTLVRAANRSLQANGAAERAIAHRLGMRACSQA